MPRLSKTQLFKKRVRDALLEHLPVDFSADPDRVNRIVRLTEWGEQYLSVSPFKGLMNLYFGVVFKSFTEVDRVAGTDPPPHIGVRTFHMSSMNMRQMKGLPYIERFPLNLRVIDETTDEGLWHCQAFEPPYAEYPPSRIAQRMIGFLGGVVFPFFERFSSLHAVRESLVLDDGWLMSGGDTCHEEVLLIDIALNNKAHFHDYIRANRENKNFPSVLQKVPMLIEKFPHFAIESPTTNS